MGARFQVLFHSPPGVLFTFPSRYWYAIGRRVVFRLGWWSTRLRPGFHVPGPTQGRAPRPACGFAYGALTLCGRPSHAVPLPTAGARPGRQPRGGAPSNPGGANAAARMRSPVWPSAPFARRYSGHLVIDFSSSGVLRCFSSPGPPPRPYAFGAGMPAPLPAGSPIRVPPDRRPCAPPRGLSRLAAPFVGSLRQGIRRAPVVSCRPLRAGATLKNLSWVIRGTISSTIVVSRCFPRSFCIISWDDSNGL